MFKLIVGPAYGRDYKSKKAVMVDWDAGKDFVILSMGPDMGRYINKEDAKGSGIQWVNIRFDNNRKVHPIKMAIEVTAFDCRLATRCPDLFLQHGDFVYPTRRAGYGDRPSGLDPDQERLWNTLWLMATNDGQSYRKSDAKGAVAKAFKEYRQSESQRVAEDYQAIAREMATQLGGYWASTRRAGAKRAEGNVVFRAKTRGDRYRIEVTDDGDGTFSMTTFTRGRPAGRSTGHNQSQMVRRVKDELVSAKYVDGINYSVEQDSLGVGRFASTRPSAGHRPMARNTGYEREELWRFYMRALQSGDTDESLDWYEELKSDGEDEHLLDVAMSTDKLPGAIRHKYRLARDSGVDKQVRPYMYVLYKQGRNQFGISRGDPKKGTSKAVRGPVDKDELKWWVEHEVGRRISPDHVVDLTGLNLVGSSWSEFFVESLPAGERKSLRLE